MYEAYEAYGASSFDKLAMFYFDTLTFFVQLTAAGSRYGLDSYPTNVSTIMNKITLHS